MSYKKQLKIIPNLNLSFKKGIQYASCSLTKKQLLSHCNQSRVLFQPMFILLSMVQVRLMNVFRLITLKVRHRYLQAHSDLQTMYSIIYLGAFRHINMGFATVFIKLIKFKATGNHQCSSRIKSGKIPYSRL